MDRSLKERLIGAAVLVALAVWLIPWVLNGPERAVEAEPEALELPSAQGAAPLRTQTIRLDENRDPPTPVARNGTDDAPSAEPAPEPSARTVESTAPVQQQSAVETQDATAQDAGAGGGEAWMVQLGSFGEEENARRLADRVATFGFSARVSTFAASGRPMFRVRVGPESSRERAVAVASSLSAHGFVAQVVSQD